MYPDKVLLPHPQLVSDRGPRQGMRSDEAPILKVSEYQGAPYHACRTITGALEMK